MKTGKSWHFNPTCGSVLSCARRRLDCHCMATNAVYFTAYLWLRNLLPEAGMTSGYFRGAGQQSLRPCNIQCLVLVLVSRLSITRESTALHPKDLYFLS